ncbi:MAG: hypothetical protein LBG42_05440 [Treponema sp.]|jgi:hypothetical protein|nr:hypothetical protein [Treponema sp.]
MDYKKAFEKFEDDKAFIKITERPAVEGARKAALNRKGNLFYNSGDVEAARRIFLTTGYSDGLSRIGDYYRSQGRLLDALRMYWTAPDRNRAEPIIMRCAVMLKDIIHKGEDEEDVHE